jgi:hypothetical protein
MRREGEIMDYSTNSTVIDGIARNCIALRLRLLNRVVTNLYNDALRPLGLTVSQLSILIVTAMLGLALPTQVCGIFLLDASTFSRNVDRMRRHGWLEVAPPRTRGRSPAQQGGPKAGHAEGRPLAALFLPLMLYIQIHNPLKERHEHPPQACLQKPSETHLGLPPERTAGR